MDQTKITVKLFEHQAKAFDKALDRLFIKRDAFLNRIIKSEVPHLAQEMEGRQLSGRARRYVSAQLKRMGTTTINVAVDKDTAESLNAVVERSNMVRDAFVNRLILFLRSPSELLTYLDLPHAVVGSAFECLPDQMPTSPLQAMESVFEDPFYYLRIAAEERHGTGLYLLELPPAYLGFSCFLDDAHVPGTKEYAALQELGEELLKDFESQAFAKTPVTEEPVGETK